MGVRVVSRAMFGGEEVEILSRLFLRRGMEGPLDVDIDVRTETGGGPSMIN